MMLECWNKDPTKQPDFHALVSLLDRTLEPISGYVQVQMNLAPVECEGGGLWLCIGNGQGGNVHTLHLCRKLIDVKETYDLLFAACTSPHCLVAQLCGIK